MKNPVIATGGFGSIATPDKRRNRRRDQIQREWE